MKLRSVIEEILQKIQEKRLDEGLILSYDVNRVIGILWRADYDSKLFNGENNRFKVRCDVDMCDFKGLFAITNKCGWYPAQIYGMKKGSPTSEEKFTEKNFKKFIEIFNIIEILFEPKYDVQITDLPDYMYHFTKKINWYKIQRKGLNPKTQSKTSNHPERVYLAYTSSGAEKFGRKVVNRIVNPPENSTNKIDYSIGVILKIDMKYCEELDFYQDPNFKGEGVYCLDSIRPLAISIEKEIDLLY